MKEEKKGVFTIVNDKGEEVECEILFTFDSDETKKSYIVYTDNVIDEDGFLKTYAGIYQNNNGKEILLPVVKDEEWALIEKLLKKVDKED